MIVVKLMDGLGNQMFQYAFGRYLQTVYHEPMILETMKLQNSAVRRLGIQNLCIPLVDKNPDSGQCRLATGMENRLLQAFSKTTRTFAQKICHIPMSGEDGYHRMTKWGFYTTTDSITYYPFEYTFKKCKFVRGYFQSEKYFAPVADLLRRELRVRDELLDHEKCLFIRELEECNSVCVHIRRGDYVGSRRYEVCTEDYYQRAMVYISEQTVNPVFYIFSNTNKDLEWVKENYCLPGKLRFVDVGENEFHDLCFMYHCKHHIISNSTFSWWGSYLAKQEGNITVCPRIWVHSDEKQDVLREKWVLL